jgi:hypothetical protein
MYELPGLLHELLQALLHVGKLLMEMLVTLRTTPGLPRATAICTEKKEDAPFNPIS